MNDMTMTGFAGLGAESLLDQLDAMIAEVPGVRLGEDREHVHRMRVAARRLRSILGLCGEDWPAETVDAWKRPVRRLARRLGAARDTDVQIEFLVDFMYEAPKAARPGLERLLLRLQQRRAKEQRRVVAALERFERSGLVESMRRSLRAQLVRARLGRSAAPGALALLKAGRAVASRLENLLSYDDAVPAAGKSAELHEMRIATKRLRYTLDTFSPFFATDLKFAVSAAKEVQRLLGEIHDADVWLDYLPAYASRERERTLAYFGHERAFKRLQPGLDALERHCRARRDEMHATFVHCWEQLRRDGVWETVYEAVRQAPGTAGLQQAA